MPQSTAEERPCADKILANIAGRAFRAPQQQDDLSDIMHFYERGHREGGFEAGLQQALSRLLVKRRL